MTTSTKTHSQAAAFTTVSRNVAKSQPRLSLAEFFDVVQKTLTMARSVPRTGRISAKQVEQLRVMAATI
jgi:hypothetical protein